MSFVVPIEIEREFSVTCGFDRVFDLLSDVPESASHFPKVEKLDDLGDNTFRWSMKKIGLASYSIQVVYACAYTDNRDEGWVEWKPVESEGNATLEGFWNFEIENNAVFIEFYIKGEVTLDLPFLTKMVISPLVVAEFNSLVDTYIKNLKKTFAGG